MCVFGFFQSILDELSINCVVSKIKPINSFLRFYRFTILIIQYFPHGLAQQDQMKMASSCAKIVRQFLIRGWRAQRLISSKSLKLIVKTSNSMCPYSFSKIANRPARPVSWSITLLCGDSNAIIYHYHISAIVTIVHQSSFSWQEESLHNFE